MLRWHQHLHFQEKKREASISERESSPHVKKVYSTRHVFAETARLQTFLSSVIACSPRLRPSSTWIITFFQLSALYAIRSYSAPKKKQRKKDHVTRDAMLRKPFFLSEEPD
jgi:hypothetical protein